MWVWTGFCTGANGYKSTIQYKGGSEISCSLWKMCYRWKLSSQIVERNVGLDGRNDIDKDVKIVCMHLFQIMHATKNCIINTDHLTFFIINAYYRCEMNWKLFVFNCISFKASIEYHILYYCPRWTMCLVFIICLYLLYSRKRWYAVAVKESRFVLVCFFCGRKRLS